MARTAHLALTLLAACAARAPELTPVTASLPLDTMPEVAETGAWAPPVPSTFTLSNGLTVWHLPQPGLPLVSVRLVVHGGSSSDAAGAHGLANLTDALLLHGAGERDAVAFSSAAELLAIDLDVATGALSSTVALDAHADRLGDGLDLLADMVLRPTFADDELDRARDLHLGEIAQLKDSARTLARVELRQRWFGTGHPLAHPAIGTAADLASIDRGAVVADWQARFQANRAGLVVSGDIDTDTLKSALEARLGGWTADGEPPMAEVPPAAGLSTPTERILVHKAEATQSVLSVVLPGWVEGDPAVEAARLGTIALGGTFTSRLNRKLREEEGYTYGARAWLESGPAYGMLHASTAVKGAQTAPALRDLEAILEAFPQGIEDDELTKASGAWRTGVIESMGSRSGIASAYADELSAMRGVDELGGTLQKALAIERSEVDTVISQVSLDKALILVVGDADAIQGELEALGGTWAVVR